MGIFFYISDLGHGLQLCYNMVNISMLCSDLLRSRSECDSQGAAFDHFFVSTIIKTIFYKVNRTQIQAFLSDVEFTKIPHCTFNGDKTVGHARIDLASFNFAPIL
jgi:hypothetical protein